MKRLICLLVMLVFVFLLWQPCFAQDVSLQENLNQKYTGKIITLKAPMIITGDISTLNYVNSLRQLNKTSSLKEIADMVEKTLGAKVLIAPSGGKMYVSEVAMIYTGISPYIQISFVTKEFPICFGIGNDLVTNVTRVAKSERPKNLVEFKGGVVYGSELGRENDDKIFAGDYITLPSNNPFDSPTYRPAWMNGPREVGAWGAVKY